MSKSRKPERSVFSPEVLQRPAANPLARLIEAQQLLASGRSTPAEILLNGLLGEARSRPEAHYLLAISALMTERTEAALAHAAQAVAEVPGDARYQFALGRAHKAGDDLDAAEAAYSAALQANPKYAEAMVSLGVVRRARGDLDAAIFLYQRAIECNERLAAAHANLANALALRAEFQVREGFNEEADNELVDSQGRAVALDPGNPQLHRNYGVLLLRARRRRDAVAAFNASLTLDPTDVESCLRLGASLLAIGNTAMACQAYETWLQRNPPQAPVLRALAGALTRGGEIDAALEWTEKAIALEPDASTLISFGNTLMQSRRLEEALSRCREGVDLGGRRADQYSVMLLGFNYLHESPEPIFAAHGEFASRIDVVPQRPAWRPRPQRLRVGYVSGDFLRHSVSYFVQGLLERHDSDRFEVFCYHNNARSDAVTEHLKSLGHQWVECDGLSDDALRRRVIADGIDILVDLSGHTSGTRLFMFAMGAAPVQISFLGYPTISGVPAMDFRITDATIDPGDQPELAHDCALLLPRTMFCYRPSEHLAVAEPPWRRNGFITFGSFNNIAKVTDHTLTMWAKAMLAVPDSRLLLKSSSFAQPSNRANLERFMGEQGIAAERLIIQRWQTEKAGHLGMYNEVDIALDTFPYNGATTTCEALWMGVPVVSRRGATHTSRMGASLLGAIGQPGWVADSDEAFVQVAARLASDGEGLTRWRAEARAHLQASELFDETGFARDFLAALDEAWARRGADTPTQTIDIA
jgi:protein O-GlcNAc transferase